MCLEAALAAVKNHHKAHCTIRRKNQNPKNLRFFDCTVYTCAEKSHNIRGFWHEKRMREKPESHTCVLVSGAHARLLSTFDRTRVVRIYVAGRACRVHEGWRIIDTTWPKNANSYRRDPERAFTHWSKTRWNFGGHFRKITQCGGGFFDSGDFLRVFRG